MDQTLPRAPLAVALGAIAFAACLWLTRAPGPGLTPDGMSYLGAAESWASGHGLRVPYAAWSDADSTAPLRVFAPGFPLAIGAAMRLGATSIQGARLVEALAAGVAVGALVWLVHLLAGGIAAVLAAGAAMAAPFMVSAHLSVLSEPLFLACFMVALARMTGAPAKPLGYGVAAAAALATRYAAGALSAACTLWAFLQPGALRQRLRRAALAAAPSMLVLVAWWIRTRLVVRRMPAGIQSPRLGLSGILHDLGVGLGNTFAPSLDEWRAQVPLALLVLALVAVLLVQGWRRPAAEPVRPLMRAAGLFAACYLALLLGARIFVGHTIPFDDRILAPILLSLLAVVAAHLGLGWPSWRRPARAVAVLLVAAWFAGATRALSWTLEDVRAHGFDFGDFTWRGSATIRWLRLMAVDRAIFTNHPVPVYYLLHRPSRVVPVSLAPDSVRAFAAAVGRQPSVIVAFHDNSWDPATWTIALASRAQLHEVARLDDGVIWLADPR
jgi:hypothetical protein